MKFYLYIFSISFILISSNLKALDRVKNIDSVFRNTTVRIDTLKIKKPILFINFSTGLLINKTFGIHPLLDLNFKYRHNDDYFNLIYEHRFGNSKNQYSILDNDTLRLTNVYSSDYIGFEYERMLIRKPNHEFYSIVGLGYDWIEILRNKEIVNYKLIGGLGLNAGIGYTFYIHKKHGPNLEILYHYVSFNNDGGSGFDNNSIILRLKYYFSNNN